MGRLDDFDQDNYHQNFLRESINKSSSNNNNNNNNNNISSRLINRVNNLSYANPQTPNYYQNIKTTNVPEPISTYDPTKKLIIHCCHHKTGTVVMEKILRHFCHEKGLKYQYCGQRGLKPDTDVWIENHSHIDFSKIDRPIRGTHMIRHPCSIIVSAYEYHKITPERWTNRKIKKLEGTPSYKDILKKFNLTDGMKFEMSNSFFTESSQRTINDIYNWDYTRENFLELKYEHLMADYNTTIRNMFKFYGFPSEDIELAVKIAKKYNIRNKDFTDYKTVHITNKKIDLDLWKKYFTKELVETFVETYPDDLFERLGYYTDDIKKHTKTLIDKLNVTKNILS
jgi:hypothetical protein